MIVDRLGLTDFRNYESADVGLVPGFNLFVGSNGQGKTNLIEALGFLSTLGSHRVSSDLAMIRQGCDAAVIRAQLSSGERQLLVEVQLNRGTANRAQVNKSAIKVRELPRYFSSVLFAPEDLSLVRGDPAGRRRFLDELLVLRSPRLSGVFADYDRVLRQRNTLLKSARSMRMSRTTRDDGSQLGTLDLWDERLIELGSEIIQARDELVVALLPELHAAYVAVAGEDHHATLATALSIRSEGIRSDATEPISAGTFKATSQSRVADEFRAALSRVRKSELERGITLVGPHRDDLVLGLNDLPTRGYASHGESWSFALSLKLASAVILRRESTTGDPVLILDDVFAELDESRRARLAKAIDGFEQVLITAAVFDEVPAELTGHTVRIDAGRIVPEE